MKTTYPTADIVVAGLNVLDFGADPSGRNDSTAAFQEALNRMHETGGGTVFAPEGKYAFEGNLYIPVSVTLRGEWREPTTDNAAVRGTILMPLAGKGDPDGKPFITVDYCAGIKDLNIWYPKQSFVQPDSYPWCLIQKGGDNATFENLTLVNPYQGIRIGPGGNELHMIRNVYGTPLKTGIQYDSTTDIGRLEKIRFSPRWWCLSGLPGAPHRLDWTRENGTAIHMLRSDWEYVANVEIDGYARGYLISEGVKGSANAQFYHLIIRDCATAMEVEKTNPFGMVFTECYFDGIEYGVLLDRQFDSTVLFSTCIFGGKTAMQSDGTGKVFMEQCRIQRGNLELERGAHSILGSVFTDRGSRIQVGENVDGLILSGNDFPTHPPMVQSKAPDGTIQYSDERPPLLPIPDYPNHVRNDLKPGKRALRIVQPSGGDDTTAIQQAMNELGNNGGGIVLLPGEDYRIEGHLSVPTGIELRGVHDVPHHTMGGGSVLHVYPPDGKPTLSMASRSGLRGLGFNYPQQNIDDVKEYPFLIQGNGNDIYIINVNAANPYKFIDFMTHRCDAHYIDYASGAPLKTGIAVGGGSLNGIVMNMQFNPHYWSRAPGNNPFYSNRTRGGMHGGSGRSLWDYQKENLDALVVGDSNNEFLYQNFVFGSLYGIHFTRQTGDGAVDCLSHGHGTDGSKVGVYFDDGHGEIKMVNNQLVAMSSQNKTYIKVSGGFDSEASLVNTLVWGHPDLLAEIGNGTLILQNLHADKHGNGLLIEKGKLHALNISFNTPGKHVAAEPGTDVELDGIITRGPFTSDVNRPRHLIEQGNRSKQSHRTGE